MSEPLPNSGPLSEAEEERLEQRARERRDYAVLKRAVGVLIMAGVITEKQLEAAKDLCAPSLSPTARQRAATTGGV